MEKSYDIIKVIKITTNLSSVDLARYSRSIKLSIRFLMTTGLGVKRALSCSITCMKD